jgi:protein-L-isoaspartate(D-aspartate) O-methyltransferase
MVNALVASGAIYSAGVRRAFLAEPREHYVVGATRASDDAGRLEAVSGDLDQMYDPEAALVTATDARGLPMSSSSAPAIMAPMLEALELRPGHRVLEVGAGTGYNAALICRLVAPGGQVTSVDVDRGIAGAARRALGAAGHPARVVMGDGRGGWPARAPFDRIIATASTDTIYRAWRDQLADGGILVCPFRFGWAQTPQAVLVLRRRGDMLHSTRVIPGAFMALRAPGQGEYPLVSAPSLGASSISGEQRTGFVAIIGRRVASLSNQQQRRLLALTLGKPRRRRSLPRATGGGLLMFLTLHPGIETVQCTLAGQLGLGIIAQGGSSFAAITTLRNTVHIAAWGEPPAQRQLDQLISEWRRLGAPDLTRLQVSVHFNPTRRVTPKPWRQLHTSEAVMSLGWHPK